MATLDNSNVVNGQTVEATDITQLYTALGTGSPGTITGLVMTGSLEGNAATATLATSATTATTATNANFPRVTNSTTLAGTGYAVPFVQTSPADTAASYISLFVDSGSASGMTYSPSADLLTVTASYASEALSTVSSSYSSVTETSYVFTTPDSASPSTKDRWVPFGGVVPISAGAAFDVTTVFPAAGTPTFGVNFIITGNQIVTPGAPPVLVSPSLGAGGNPNILTFEGASGDVMYQGWYLSL
jgi:hypothetical protein